MAGTSRGPFAGLLRHHRVIAGLSQEALAEKAGLSSGAISALERGVNTQPQLHTVQRLAAALELSPDERVALLAAARKDTGPQPPSAGETHSAPRAALPLPLTPLLGREADLRRLTVLLANPACRLLTLVGPGGTGKTRLALALATLLHDDFADGTAFVDLSPLRDPALVLPTIAGVLQVREARGQSLGECLVDSLRERRLLLVLDNVEQVIAAAPDVAALVAACGRLTVLATSRAPLRLRGETEFPVSTLALPDPAQTRDPIALAASPAVALFRDRVVAVCPNFAITPENASAVAEICTHLDGLPLALELAAPALKILSPQALQSRLNRMLPLLAGGARDLPARQRTLRATLEWSHDLLTNWERACFRRLAVFVGGGTVTAAETVLASLAEPNADHDQPWNPQERTDNALAGLMALADQSLLRITSPGNGEEPRWVMLETVREYAAERLAASGEAETAREAHAAYYQALAEEAEPYLTTGARGRWVLVLRREQENLRATLRWVIDRGRTQSALCLSKALTWFWYLQGDLTEGRTWLAASLDLQPVTMSRERAAALAGAGTLAHLQGDEAAAHPLLTDSIALWRTLRDCQGLAYALTSLGQVVWFQGDSAMARTLGEESVSLLRATSDRWGLALALQDLGQVVLDTGDLLTAQSLYEEILMIYSDLGDRWGRGLPLLGLGRVALARGELVTAAAMLRESQTIFTEAEDRRLLAHVLYRLGQLTRREREWVGSAAYYYESIVLWQEVGQRLGLGLGLSGLAGVVAGQGEPERAARYWGAADGALMAIGATLSRSDHADEASYRAAAEETLGPRRFAALCAEGRARPLVEVLADAAAWTMTREAEGEPIS